jgi:lambda family phage portal protein
MTEAATSEFRYRPPFVTRMAERFFPQWGERNRQAALQSHIFDQVASRRGFQRSVSQFAASYDILGGDRSRKGYVRSLIGTGDVHLTEQALSDLREVARDASRNDPVIKGLLETYAEGIVGTELPIQARSSDEQWNKNREAAWKETMLDKPCDNTGRFSFPHCIFLALLSFSRDGDFFILFREEGPQLIEGERVGSPSGLKMGGETFDVNNGVATEKTTGRVIGYYVGTPNRWGYIEAANYARHTANEVHQIFDPDRVSYTRGEPLLTPSMQWFDKFGRYADAELVTSCVQACQGIAIKHKAGESLLPGAMPQKDNAEVNTEDKLKRFQMAPGMVWDLDPDADVANIGATRPTTVFGEFMNKVLTIAGRAAGMPLMLVTQDLSGATFMNARVAMQFAQERWRKVQAFVVSPLASRWYLWQTERDIAADKELRPAPKDWRLHEVMCRRWPYVDPEKEAKADEIELRNGTTSRTFICARSGRDYRDVVRERVKDAAIEADEGLQPDADPPQNDGANRDQGKGDGNAGDVQEN